MTIKREGEQGMDLGRMISKQATWASLEKQLNLFGRPIPPYPNPKEGTSS